MFIEGTVEDITERKEIEAAVRRNEARFRALIERNADAIVVVDQDGTILPYSLSVERVLGIDCAEWTGRNIFEIVHPNDLDRARANFARCLGNHGTPITADVRARHQDGHWVWFETVAVNLVDDPDVRGVVINARDISERMAATEELRLSENRLRALIDGALDAVLVADETGRYVDANPAACSLLGVSREDLLRKRLEDFVANPDVGATNRQYDQFVEDGRQEGIFQMVRADGEVIEVEFRATANFWPGLHLSILRDVTERVRTERLLRESEERFRTIFDSSAIGIALLKIDGRMITCNRAYQQMVGFSETELKERGIRAITHPDDMARETQLIREVIEGTSDSYQIEKRYIRPDSEIVWVRLTVSMIRETNHGEPLVIGMVEDITERMRATHALRESEERFRAMFEGAGIGIGLMDETRRFIACNSAMHEMFGYSEQEMLSNDRELFVHPDDLTSDETSFNDLIAGIRDRYQIEKRYVRRNDQELWGRLTMSSIRRDHGESPLVVCMLEDITDRKQVELQLVHDAFHDPLTGLPNRALFIDRLDHVLVRATRRTEQYFAVLFLDLDRFKVVNDSLGHLKGDQLLVAIAHRLRLCVRPDDTVARLGGDEFTILLEDLNHPADATRVASRILEALNDPVDLDGVDIYTSASIGIALGSTDYEKSIDLLRDADAAMYYAKSLGRSRYELFDSKMHVEAMSRLQLEIDLRRAVDNQEFMVHYQPIVSLRDSQIAWFEALVRWSHPLRGLVSPDEFIPLAEETGLIVSIDRYVLREACQQMRLWLEKSPDDERISVGVNLSGKHFNDPDLPAFVERVLKEEGIDGRRLRLEITESMVMDDVRLARTTLARLRELGVHVHMDDFGTGYSSLSVLHSFSLSKLKIDRSFVSRWVRKVVATRWCWRLWQWRTVLVSR